jgi:hypothetical protein
MILFIKKLKRGHYIGYPFNMPFNFLKIKFILHTVFLIHIAIYLNK